MKVCCGKWNWFAILRDDDCTIGPMVVFDDGRERREWNITPDEAAYLSPPSVERQPPVGSPLHQSGMARWKAAVLWISESRPPDTSACRFEVA